MKFFSIFFILFFYSACSAPFFDSIFFTNSRAKTAALQVLAPKTKSEQPKEPEQKLAIKPEPQVVQPIKQSTQVKKSEFKKIAFVGDSHLASDYMSEYFRKALGINSLGFIQPILPKWHHQYRAVYKNSGFSTEYLINTKNNLSFGGINAACSALCELNIELKFKARELFVIEFQSGNSRIKKLAKNVEKLNYKTSANIGGFINLANSFVDNLGINGASIYNYQRINKDLAKEVAQLLGYELVIFSFGTNESVAKNINDEQFLKNYQAIIDIFKGAKIVILIPPEPVLYQNKSYVVGENNEKVRKLLRAIASKNDALIFDINALMQKEGGKNAWIESKKSLKNTHLTKAGYDYVAAKLLQFLKNIKDENER